jgi:membrane-associated phospholipid phosphatase
MMIVDHRNKGDEMHLKFAMGFVLSVLSLPAYAQEPASDVSSGPDSSAAPVVDAAMPVVEKAGAAPVAATPLASPEGREVSWLKLPRNIIQDQRAIWLSPLKLKEPRYWIPTAALLGVTVGLMELDPKEGHYFRNSQFYNPYNNVFAGTTTSRAMWAFPFALYGAGLLAGDSKMKSTALLVGEAVADSEILTTIAKDIDRRKRPQDLPVNGNFSNTWFVGKEGGVQSNGSFPSGHTIAAFSTATIIAHRYGNHKWVPYVAYGTAAAVAFSRLTLSSHWGSDVFVGGVLGYTISRFAVLHE